VALQKEVLHTMEVNLFPNFVQSPLFGHAMINLPIPLQSLQVRYPLYTRPSPLIMLPLVLTLAALTCCALCWAVAYGHAGLWCMVMHYHRSCRWMLQLLQPSCRQMINGTGCSDR